jgi:hypothetical protein
VFHGVSIHNVHSVHKAHSAHIVHRVHGVDAHASLTLNPINVFAEYVTAVSQFSPQDMTYNDKAAKPSAYDLEAAYTFNWGWVPASWAVGTSGSRQALALGLPKSRYSTTLNLSFWKDTVLSFEVRHDINYSKNATATGAGVNAVSSPNNLGHTDNAVTTQLDVYF